MIEKIFPKEMSRLWTTILSIILAILIGGILITINGDNPFLAYLTMLQRSLGSIQNISGTLAVATPLIFTGLSCAVAFRSGLDNIGSEGQLYMGAMSGALVGIFLKGFPPLIHVFLALFAAAISGGIWAWIFGWLKVKINVNLVITTMLGNYLAILFTSYLSNYPLKPPRSPIPATAYIEDTARLAHLFPFSTLNVGFLIGFGILVVVGLFFGLTRTGFEWKTIGLNINFARYIGMNVDRQLLLAMFISGALAGIGGAVEVLGVQGRFVQGISPGYGYDGILVALLAGNSAPGVLAVAVLFGILRVGGIGVEQVTNVPSELSYILQSTIILLVAAQVGIFKFIQIRRRAHYELDSTARS
jgi:ABC-type uncharacterized transport system permease subunit